MQISNKRKEKTDFHFNKSFKSLASLVVICSAFQAQQGLAAGGKWGLNVAYHNPVNALLGVNLDYFGANWAFEIGAGGADGNASSKNEDEKIGTGIWGDLDIKYRFGSKTFRPYLEGGFTYGLRLGSSGSGVGTGTPFVGGGVFIDGSKMFGFGVVDYVINSKGLNIGAGIGFKL